MKLEEIGKIYAVPNELLSHLAQDHLLEENAQGYTGKAIQRASEGSCLYQIGFSIPSILRYFHLEDQGTASIPMRIAILQKRRDESLCQLHTIKHQLDIAEALLDRLQEGYDVLE